MFLLDKSIYSLRKFDMFGRYLTFTNDFSQKHHTLLGFCVTVIIILFVTVIGIIYGIEIVNKKNGNITISEELLDYSRIAMKDLPIIISFFDYYGNHFENADEYFEFKFWNINFENNFSKNITVVQEITECDYINFSEKSKNFVQTILRNNKESGIKSYCFPNTLDGYFQNPYFSLNSTLQIFELNICNTTNSSCKKNFNDSHLFCISNLCC